MHIKSWDTPSHPSLSAGAQDLGLLNVGKSSCCPIPPSWRHRSHQEPKISQECRSSPSSALILQVVWPDQNPAAPLMGKAGMISASKGRQTDKLIKTNNNLHFPLQPHSPLCLTVARSFTLRIFHILILEVSLTLLTTKTFPHALIQSLTYTVVTPVTCSLSDLLLYYQ